MSDPAEVIARVKAHPQIGQPLGQICLRVNDVQDLLDAAEAGMTARDAGFDAGLEVSAALAENALQGTLAAAIRTLKKRPA